MLRSGVSLYEAMDTMAEVHRGQVRRLFQSIHEAIKHGQGLGTAMAMQPTYISHGDAVLVEASEEIGKVPEALDRLAGFYKFQVELLKQNIFMLLYPTALYILSLFLLNLPLLITHGASAYMAAAGWGLFYLLIPIALFFLAVSFVPLRPLWSYIKVIAWHIPVVSIPLKHMGTSLYAKGIAAGLAAGFGIEKTIDIARKLSNIPGIDKKL